MSAFLPNPLTPLAFLSPEEAYQTTVTNYASIGALAVRCSRFLNVEVEIQRVLHTHIGSDMGHLGQCGCRLSSAHIGLELDNACVYCFPVRATSRSSGPFTDTCFGIQIGGPCIPAGLGNILQ